MCATLRWFRVLDELSAFRLNTFILPLLILRNNVWIVSMIQSQDSTAFHLGQVQLHTNVLKTDCFTCIGPSSLSVRFLSF